MINIIGAITGAALRPGQRLDSNAAKIKLTIKPTARKDEAPVQPTKGPPVAAAIATVCRRRAPSRGVSTSRYRKRWRRTENGGEGWNNLSIIL